MDLTPGPGEDHAPEVIYQAAGQMLAQLGATENYEPDLFEWHHCAACPNADGPCACTGGPWPSSDVRAVLDLAYRAGREEAARDIQAKIVPGMKWPFKPGAVVTAEALRDWIAALAREDDQPRTPQGDVAQTPTSGGEQ